MIDVNKSTVLCTDIGRHNIIYFAISATTSVVS